jgi:hypothetical protein
MADNGFHGSTLARAAKKGKGAKNRHPCRFLAWSSPQANSTPAAVAAGNGYSALHGAPAGTGVLPDFDMGVYLR